MSKLKAFNLEKEYKMLVIKTGLMYRLFLYLFFFAVLYFISEVQADLFTGNNNYKYIPLLIFLEFIPFSLNIYKLLKLDKNITLQLINESSSHTESPYKKISEDKMKAITYLANKHNLQYFIDESLKKNIYISNHDADLIIAYDSVRC